MTTIVIASRGHNPQTNRWSVFRTHEINDGYTPDGKPINDRFLFGIEEFDEQSEAEQHARWMMEKYEADHLERAV